jgi:hypothetical protein
MKLGLNWRHELHDANPAIVKELDQMISGLAGWSDVEHNEDGSHKDMTAESVDVSGSHDIGGHANMHAGVAMAGAIRVELTEDVTEFSPVGIDAAYYVKVVPSGTRNVSGIQDGPRKTPRAGRKLWLKNAAPSGVGDIVLKHEDTSAREVYRFDLPDGVDMTISSSRSVHLYYDAEAGRWTTP